jgi:hypothetical protein
VRATGDLPGLERDRKVWLDHGSHVKGPYVGTVTTERDDLAVCNFEPARTTGVSTSTELESMASRFDRRFGRLVGFDGSDIVPVDEDVESSASEFDTKSFTGHIEGGGQLGSSLS